MGHPAALRTCVIAGALVFSGAAGVLAQNPFTIYGRVKVDGGSLDGTRMVVYKDGEKQRTVASGLGKFSLDLDLNSSYILSFEKDGFVTKKLSFDTHVPADAAASPFTPFDFAVSIFKQYDDVNTVVFNQPVGMIRYDATAGDFDYDTDYTKSIQSAMQTAMDQVAKKQEEEKARDEADARRKADEEKANAKAAAEKAKQDAELAKQQAKEKQAQEAAAKKEQERKDAEAKKEAEAKKAADERLAEEARKAREKPAPPPPPAPKPKPEPPPAPVAKVAPPKPKPIAPPPAPVHAQRTTSRSPAHEGADVRHAGHALQGDDARPTQTARANNGSEQRSAPDADASDVSRHEELIVEPNQVITLIRLDNGHATVEYRKVVHKYGPVFYFKNGQSCTKLQYESEALAENR